MLVKPKTFSKKYFPSLNMGELGGVSVKNDWGRCWEDRSTRGGIALGLGLLDD